MREVGSPPAQLIAMEMEGPDPRNIQEVESAVPSLGSCPRAQTSQEGREQMKGKAGVTPSFLDKLLGN